MDSPDRSFLGLAAVSALIVGYGVCALLGLASAMLSHGGELARVGPSAPALAVVVATLLVAIPIAQAVTSVARGLLASRRLSRSIERSASPLPNRLAAAARSAGLEGRLSLLVDLEPRCFAYGTLTPRVAISVGLADALDDDELLAVLEHERHHVGNLDPLRSLLARALAESFFMVPLLAHLRERYEAARELAADRSAALACGPRPLAGALLKSLDGSDDEDGRVPFASPEPLLALRIAQIERGQPPALRPPGASLLTRSVAGGSAALLLLALAESRMPGLAPLAAVGVHPLHSDLLLGFALCVAPILAGGALALRYLAARA